MKTIKTVEEAQKAIEAFDGKAEELELPISDNLQDPAGLNMAIVSDGILLTAGSRMASCIRTVINYIAIGQPGSYNG